ncbi:sensor histidine kinase [Pelotalea chapellei]|nr:HAMP domain-containing sensor histidine kinase [Pelotalea chapellei]
MTNKSINESSRLSSLEKRNMEERIYLLEQRLLEAEAEINRKDQMLIKQSRQADMGEMINNIAHQWRQPLNNLGLLIQNMQLMQEIGELTPDILRGDCREAMEIIFFMSRTIEDFRDFFRQDKEKKAFLINEVISKTLNFISATLENSSIKVEVDASGDVTAIGYQNEYFQVLLNIIANARDVLVEKKPTSPLIRISIANEGDSSVVKIRDNGGGIPAEVIPRIFDSYFTTKGHGKGTGIGLYMSKVIIEKNCGGRLSAYNVDDGVEFRIEV